MANLLSFWNYSEEYQDLNILSLYQVIPWNFIKLLKFVSSSKIKCISRNNFPSDNIFRIHKLKKKLIKVVFFYRHEKKLHWQFPTCWCFSHTRQSLYYLHTRRSIVMLWENTKTFHRILYLTCLRELSEVFVTKCLKIKKEKATICV